MKKIQAILTCPLSTIIISPFILAAQSHWSTISSFPFSPLWKKVLMNFLFRVQSLSCLYYCHPVALPTSQSDSMSLLPQMVSSSLFLLPLKHTTHWNQTSFHKVFLLYFNQQCPRILMYGCNIWSLTKETFPHLFWWTRWRGLWVLGWLWLSVGILWRMSFIRDCFFLLFLIFFLLLLRAIVRDEDGDFFSFLLVLWTLFIHR